MLYYTILYYTILYYTILYYTVLYYTILILYFYADFKDTTLVTVQAPEALGKPKLSIGQLSEAEGVSYMEILHGECKDYMGAMGLYSDCIGGLFRG